MEIICKHNIYYDIYVCIHTWNDYCSQANKYICCSIWLTLCGGTRKCVCRARTLKIQPFSKLHEQRIVFAHFYYKKCLMYVCECGHVYGGQRATVGSRFSPPTVGVDVGIKLKSLDLCSMSFTRWAIPLAPIHYYSPGSVSWTLVLCNIFFL